MSEITRAQAALAAEADEATNATAQRLIEAGLAEWRLDPVVPDVVGLLDTRTQNTAWIVVYLDPANGGRDDFETSDAFDREAVSR
jgi:hypothetical protein